MKERHRLKWMKDALLLAKQSQMAEVPVGALILHQDHLIAQAHNCVFTDCNPIAHAEMLVLQKASRVLHQSRLTECDMFVTLEPCPMCAQAISFARLRRVYFGAYNPKGGGVDHGPKIFSQHTCHHQPEIIGGVMETECQTLLKDFFQKKRTSELLEKSF